MAPESPTRPSARVEVAGVELREFERTLKNAHNDLWWRQFVNLIKDRRMSFMETLAGGILDQRAEDRLRGQISELSWLLALDQYAELPRRDTDGRRSEAD